MKRNGKNIRRLSVRIKPQTQCCIPDILFENGLPKNKEREGIGVESILNTAAKYSGVVDFSASEGVFVCQIILSNRRKSLSRKRM